MVVGSIAFSIAAATAITVARELSTFCRVVEVFDRDHVKAAVTITAVVFFGLGVGYARSFM